MRRLRLHVRCVKLKQNHGRTVLAGRTIERACTLNMNLVWMLRLPEHLLLAKTLHEALRSIEDGHRILQSGHCILQVQSMTWCAGSIYNSMSRRQEAVNMVWLWTVLDKRCTTHQVGCKTHIKTNALIFLAVFLLAFCTPGCFVRSSSRGTISGMVKDKLWRRISVNTVVPRWCWQDCRRRRAVTKPPANR